MKILKYLFYKIFMVESYKKKNLFFREASIGLIEEDEMDEVYKFE